MLYFFIVRVNFYHVNMLLIYDVQTIILIFVAKEWETHQIVIALCNSK